MRPAYLLIIIAGMAAVQCDGREKKADIPDPKVIHDNIDYLDSLLNSGKVDSIVLLDQRLEITLDTWRDKLQTPDDKALYDSLSRIRMVSTGFIRFCIESRTNLELLRRDITSVELQYQSGKITSGMYITALLESEQIQVDINNRFLNDARNVTEALRSSESLMQMFTSSLAPDFAEP